MARLRFTQSMKAKSPLISVFIITTTPALRAETFRKMSGNLEKEVIHSAKFAQKRIERVNFATYSRATSRDGLSRVRGLSVYAGRSHHKVKATRETFRSGTNRI